MTLEQQRIAIAEACGWTETEAWLDGRRCFERADSNAGWDFDSLPDYLNDLNAMHEAEELLYAKSDTLEGAERMRDYSKWLCNIAKYPLRATASQRAEAFLRTIGKWEEAK